MNQPRNQVSIGVVKISETSSFLPSFRATVSADPLLAPRAIMGIAQVLARTSRAPHLAISRINHAPASRPATFGTEPHTHIFAARKKT